MYHTYYGLKSDPFRLSPDHAFCYRHPSFAKGRAYMQYALRAAEGFVVVTGRPGMGKTTLINDLLSDYGPSDYLIANLVNTTLEANDLLRSVAYEFAINVETLDKATILQRLKQLFAHSRRANKPPLLVVDEAQNLGLNALEELRLLTNLQLNGTPLLQIFLVGQEGLRDKLADPRLEQLRQRITAATHLEPLSEEQTAAYVIHRLRVVGWNDHPRIKASVLPIIRRATEGVPRRINQFCSRLLLYGSVEEKAELGEADANLVLAELSDERLSKAPIVADTAVDSVAAVDVEQGQHGGSSEDAVFAAAEQLLARQKKIVVPPRHQSSPAEPGPYEDYPRPAPPMPLAHYSRPVSPAPPMPPIPPMPSMPEPMPTPGYPPPFMAERRHPLEAPANPFRQYRRTAPFGLVAMVLLLVGIVWVTVQYADEDSGLRRWADQAQRDLFGSSVSVRREDAGVLPAEPDSRRDPLADPESRFSELGKLSDDREQANPIHLIE